MTIKRPEQIYPWDFPNHDHVPDGYDLKTVPALTRENLEYLMDEHNKLVCFVNQLATKLGVPEE